MLAIFSLVHLTSSIAAVIRIFNAANLALFSAPFASASANLSRSVVASSLALSVATAFAFCTTSSFATFFRISVSKLFVSCAVVSDACCTRRLVVSA